MPTKSADSQPQSWSKLLDNQRKREFRSKYRYSSYDPPPPKKERPYARDSSYSSKYVSSVGDAAMNGARVVAESGPIYIPSEAGVKYHSTAGTHTLHLQREAVGRSRDATRGVGASVRTLSMDRATSSGYPYHKASRDRSYSSYYASTDVPVTPSRSYKLTSDLYRTSDLDVDTSPRRGGVQDSVVENYDRQRRKRDLQEQLEQTYGTSQDTTVNDIVKRVNAETYLGALRSAVPGQYRSDVGSYETPITTSRSRSTSISRMCGDSERRYHAGRGSKRSQSLSRYTDLGMDDSYDRPISTYRAGTSRSGVIKYGKSDYRNLLDSDLHFNADNVQVQVLPSGQEKTTYTKVSQDGIGNKKLANAEIEKVIRNTVSLQQSMHTLEDFVKNNRRLFPEDTIVYQQIRFFQLNEAELAKIGEPPEAVVYGVKIKEKLVVPPGTDVSEALRQYCGDRDSIEVQYRGRRQRPYELEETEDERRKANEKIRQQVEKDYEKRWGNHLGSDA